MPFIIRQPAATPPPKLKGRPKKYLLQTLTAEASQLLRSRGLKLVNIGKDEAKKHGFLWSKYHENQGYMQVFYTPSIYVYGSFYLTDGVRTSHHTMIDVRFTPISK